MNIVVLGGNCIFSSELSKALNKKLESSIIIRNNFLNNIRGILFPNIENNNFQQEYENFGEYIGDIETMSPIVFEQLCNKDTQEVITKVLESVNTFELKISSREKHSQKQDNFITKKISSSLEIRAEYIRSKLRNSNYTEMFNHTGALDFFSSVMVYSGLSDKKSLDLFLTQANRLGPTAFVILPTLKTTWVENKISKRDIEETFKENSNFLGPIFEVNDLKELLDDKTFLSFLNYVEQEAAPIAEIKEPVKKTERIEAVPVLDGTTNIQTVTLTNPFAQALAA
jgi:hypothetical protein